MTRIPDDLRRLLDDSGIEVTGSRRIDHGTQYKLVHQGETATINVYYTGKVAVGGKPGSRLRNLLEGWRIGWSGTRNEGRGVARAAIPVLDGTPRLGIDEAGKGDYFGPLVVAGVRITGEKPAAKLREIGVRDSKNLGGAQAVRMAERIMASIGIENVEVVALSPREYEDRRNAAGNVNLLLGEINASIINKLKSKVQVIVADEFARATRSYLEPFVPEGVRLEVRTRAEDDAAVAAASILARARFLEDIGRLSALVGFELPRGSTHVLEVARRVVEERGREGLEEVAKVSFKTTKRVMEAGS